MWLVNHTDHVRFTPTENTTYCHMNYIDLNYYYLVGRTMFPHLPAPI